MSEFQKVLLIAPKQSDFENFKDIKNVEYFKCDTNDTWIRDFGAIDIVENGRFKALDFTFNAWEINFKASLIML